MLNIVIPMAGAGSRFASAGYTFPKPLIEIRGKPMIQIVVDNIKPKNRTDYKFTFIVKKEHYNRYSLKNLLNLIAGDCNIITVDSLTKGAACTVLLASEYIDNDEELLIANSDQFIANGIEDYLHFSSNNKFDGTIMTFKSTHPKWSFVRLDKNANVEEVAEKKPISDIATVGIYYFKKGIDFVEGAKNMIRKNIRTNGEFYVAPVYNEMILKNKIIKVFDIKDRMYGIGTPEDLNRFLGTELINNI